ncbi:hypothetical protein AURDEDRAFT_164550 [Auricularia subglabra TFB-10046 SS5]|nr:hypothetical protein AURDEDRAFT_164550 [Auricularia subglabra TFB-10046 SS5]
MDRTPDAVCFVFHKETAPRGRLDVGPESTTPLRKCAPPRAGPQDSAQVVVREILEELEKELVAAYSVTTRRMAGTNGRGFMLRLRTTVSGILPALVQQMAHVAALEVQLEDLEEARNFLEFMRLSQAPSLRVSANYAHMESFELLRDSWEIASGMSWPLEPIPHVFAASSLCRSLPFLPPTPIPRAHLVIEQHQGSDLLIRVGNDDWSWSRTRVAFQYSVHAAGSEDGSPQTCFDMQIHAVRGSIRTATLPVELWPSSQMVARDVDQFLELRLVFSENGSMPTLGYDRRFRCYSLETLTLRGPPGPALQLQCADVVQFARRELEAVVLPLHLRLENVVLLGNTSDDFSEYFRDVETRDAEAWSYLRVQPMLNRTACGQRLNPLESHCA